jgi:hypothetical protein
VLCSGSFEIYVNVLEGTVSVWQFKQGVVEMHMRREIVKYKNPMAVNESVKINYNISQKCMKICTGIASALRNIPQSCR